MSAESDKWIRKIHRYVIFKVKVENQVLFTKFGKDHVGKSVKWIRNIHRYLIFRVKVGGLGFYKIWQGS